MTWICCWCQKALERDNTVQLACSCYITICLHCARNAIFGPSGQSEIRCIECGSGSKPLSGVDRALEHERLLVLEGMKIAGIEQPETAAKKDKLKACLEELQRSDKQLHTLDRKGEVLKKKVAKEGGHHSARWYRSEISRAVHSRGSTSLELPLNMIQFHRNLHIENTLRDSKSVPERKCSVCRGEVAAGQSVLLTCSCVVCQTCAIDSILDGKLFTFHNNGSSSGGSGSRTKESPMTAIPCPSCQAENATFTVKNVEALTACEEALYSSAGDYLIPGVKWKNLLRWFWALGYSGQLKDERDLAAASRERITLEVTILEEQRLNEMGLLTTLSSPMTEAEACWGLLRGADIPYNSILERALWNREPPPIPPPVYTDGGTILDSDSDCAEPATPKATAALGVTTSGGSSSSSCSSRSSVLSGMVRQLKDAALPRADLRRCSSLEKLVLVAMFMHRDPADVNAPYTFSTAEEVCTAVEVVLARMRKQQSLHKDLVAVLKDKVTEKVQAMLSVPNAGLIEVLGPIAHDRVVGTAVDTAGEQTQTVQGRWRAVDVRTLQPGADVSLRVVLGPTLFVLTQEGSFVSGPPPPPSTPRSQARSQTQRPKPAGGVLDTPATAGPSADDTDNAATDQATGATACESHAAVSSCAGYLEDLHSTDACMQVEATAGVTSTTASHTCSSAVQCNPSPPSSQVGAAGLLSTLTAVRKTEATTPPESVGRRSLSQDSISSPFKRMRTDDCGSSSSGGAVLSEGKSALSLVTEGIVPTTSAVTDPTTMSGEGSKTDELVQQLRRELDQVTARAAAAERERDEARLMVAQGGRDPNEMARSANAREKFQKEVSQLSRAELEARALLLYDTIEEQRKQAASNHRRIKREVELNAQLRRQLEGSSGEDDGAK